MSAEDPLNTKKTIAEIVLDTGVDPVPSGTITNAIEITDDSTLLMDQVTMNSQANVVGRTMSKKSDITGSLAGSCTLNGNLHSTDGALEPAIGKVLEISGMKKTECLLLELAATAANVVEGDEVTGVTSLATGIVKILDDDKVFVEVTSGTFEAEVLNQDVSVVGTITGFTELAFLYSPDSDSTQVGSVFFYKDGKLMSLKKCAGNITFSMESGGLVTFTASLLGKKDTTNFGDAALPDATFLENLPPVFMDSQTLFTWSGGTFVPIHKTGEYNIGATPVLRTNAVDATGLEGAFVSTRADATGSIQIEETLASEFDPQTMKEANIEVIMSQRIGNGAAGRTVYFRQNMTIADLSFSNVDLLNVTDISYGCVDNTDSDAEQYILMY